LKKKSNFEKKLKKNKKTKKGEKLQKKKSGKESLWITCNPQ
jgi:hypothetical protein